MLGEREKGKLTEYSLTVFWIWPAIVFKPKVFFSRVYLPLILTQQASLSSYIALYKASAICCLFPLAFNRFLDALCYFLSCFLSCPQDPRAELSCPKGGLHPHCRGIERGWEKHLVGMKAGHAEEEISLNRDQQGTWCPYCTHLYCFTLWPVFPHEESAA